MVIPKSENKEIVNKYLIEKLTMVQIADLYNCSLSPIRRILKQENVEKRPQGESRRKYQVNHNFFNQIDSENSAYILGFLMADGCNVTGLNRIDMELQERDKEILQKINDLIHPDRPLRFIEKRTERHSNMYKMTISSRQIAQDLEKFGMLPNKSLIVNFPDFLPDDIIKHVIRGWWDGDGYLGVGVGVLTSTESVCLSIAKILNDKFNINSSISKAKNIYRLSITGVDKLIIFLNWLYSDATIYMERKYQTYLEMINFIPKSPGKLKLFNKDGSPFTEEQKHERRKNQCSQRYYNKKIKN